MKEACESMLSIYPNQSYPLEVLCSHYLKTGKILLFFKSAVTKCQCYLTYSYLKYKIKCHFQSQS